MAEAPVIKIKDDWDIANTKLITGTIYLQDGDHVFPYQDWNDYPVNMLEGWIDTTISNLFKKAPYHLFYLDGPYCIKVSRFKENRQWLCRLCMTTDACSDSERILWSSQVPYVQWLHELTSAADRCVKIAGSKGIDCPDLIKRTRKLKKYSKYLRMLHV